MPEELSGNMLNKLAQQIFCRLDRNDKLVVLKVMAWSLRDPLPGFPRSASAAIAAGDGAPGDPERFGLTTAGKGERKSGPT